MNPVKTGFIALAGIRATCSGGIPETSCYLKRINRLSQGRAMLKSQVPAVSQLRNTGASNPNAGLFAWITCRIAALVLLRLTLPGRVGHGTTRQFSDRGITDGEWRCKRLIHTGQQVQGHHYGDRENGQRQRLGA